MNLNNTFLRFQKIRKGGLLLVAIASAVVLSIEKLEHLFSSPAWMYVYVVCDLLRYEIILACVLIAFAGILGRICRQCWSAMLSSAIGNFAITILLVALSLFIGTILAVSIAWQGRMYWKGKKIEFRDYSLRLIARANVAFESGHFDQARWPLQVGVKLLGSEKCATYLEKLTKRVADVQSLQKIRSHVPYDSEVRIALTESILCASPSDGQRLKSDDATLAKIVKPKYNAALTAFCANNRAECMLLLKATNDLAPNFGNSHDLLVELEEGGAKQGDLDRFPLLNALHQMGSAAFAEVMLAIPRVKAERASEE